MLKDGDDYFKYEKEVWKQFITTIANAMNNNYLCRIFVDATHLTKVSRKKIIDAIKNIQILEPYSINVIYMDIPTSICIERNKRRSGLAKVPESVIITASKSLQLPTKQEHIDNFYIVLYELEEIRQVYL